jgi:hypothetical protein
MTTDRAVRWGRIELTPGIGPFGHGVTGGVSVFAVPARNHARPFGARPLLAAIPLIPFTDAAYTGGQTGSQKNLLAFFLELA